MSTNDEPLLDNGAIPDSIPDRKRRRVVNSEAGGSNENENEVSLSDDRQQEDATRTCESSPVQGTDIEASCWELEKPCPRVLTSVRHWASPGRPNKKKSAGSGADTYAYRSPAEVSKFYFFEPDTYRYMKWRNDALDVERHILTAVLWQHHNPAIKLPDGLSHHLMPSNKKLRTVLEQFECWPTKFDLECIQSALAATKVDLFEISKIIDGYEEDRCDWIDGEHAEEFIRLSDWLGCGDDNWRITIPLWKKKIIAAAILRYVFKDEEAQQFASNESTCKNDSSSCPIHLYRALPIDLVQGILAYADASTLRRFSATSKLSKATARQTPSADGIWRRNLFFARAVHYTSPPWEWRYLCAEDVPNSDSSLVPIPHDESFFGPHAKVAPGGLSPHPVSIKNSAANKLKHTIWLEEGFNRPWRPYLDFQLHTSSEEFLAMSPFEGSANPTAMKSHVTNDFKCIFVFAGHDRFGGFIGAGVGSYDKGEFQLRQRDGPETAYLSGLTICGRYLPPTDIRLSYTTTKLLTTLLKHFRTDQITDWSIPWKSLLFSLEYIPDSSTHALIAQQSVLPTIPIPGFETKLKIACDMRGKASDYVKNYRNHCYERNLESNHCMACDDLVPSTSCITYKNDEVPGLQDVLYELNEEGAKFCDNTCFLKWIPACYPLEVVCTDALWKYQCWGCGILVDKGCTDCEFLIYYNKQVTDASPMYIEGEVINTYFGSGKFCSEVCARNALPEILRFCKEDWQVHPFTRVIRRLSLLPPDCILEDTDLCDIITREGFLPKPTKNKYDRCWILEDSTERGF